MNPIWFIRMSKWARNPPSKRMVKLVFGILAVAIAIFLIERYIGWPDWLSLERTPRLRPRPIDQ